MGVPRILGARELALYRETRQKLHLSKAIKAKCYECNGEEESRPDCEVDRCPLYPYQRAYKKLDQRKGR